MLLKWNHYRIKKQLEVRSEDDGGGGGVAYNNIMQNSEVRIQTFRQDAIQMIAIFDEAMI